MSRPACMAAAVVTELQPAVCAPAPVNQSEAASIAAVSALVFGTGLGT